VCLQTGIHYHTQGRWEMRGEVIANNDIERLKSYVEEQYLGRERQGKLKEKQRQKNHFRGPRLSYGELLYCLSEKPKHFFSGMELLRCSFIWPGKVKVRE